MVAVVSIPKQYILIDWHAYLRHDTFAQDQNGNAEYYMLQHSKYHQFCLRIILVIVVWVEQSQIPTDVENCG